MGVKKTNALKSFWSRLTPKSKKVISASFVVITIVVVALFGYYSSHRGEQTQQKQQKEEAVNITLQPGILQKNINSNVNHKLQEFKKELEQLKKQRELEKELANKQQTNKLNKTQQTEKSQQTTNKQTSSASPAYNPSGLSSGADYHNPNNKIQPKPEVIGAIGVADNTDAESKSIESLKKKQKQTEEGVYLPPSFMQASLLSGLDAPTMNGAKSNPVPVLLRVRAPAVLPNRVRANLKGCFIIAEGVGNLASERVMLRLVSLSCIAKDGKAVIDQPIKGFVVGSDGKIGLRGRVVSKMGAVLARAALAGFLTGFGNAIQTSAATTYTSTLGTSSSINSGDVARSALGGGVSSAAKKLADFYMKLADQTLPVIEIGATRRVTAVISKGETLNIKNVCVGGQKCED